MEEARSLQGEGATAVKDISVFVPEAHRKSGELGAAALAFLLGVLGYYFALDMTSGEYSSPSVFPKFASVIIMASSAFIFARGLKKEKEKDAPGLFAFLLPMDVVAVVVLLVVYCMILPWAGLCPLLFFSWWPGWPISRGERTFCGQSWFLRAPLRFSWRFSGTSSWSSCRKGVSVWSRVFSTS